MPIKDPQGSILGVARCVLYLEDLGEVIGPEAIPGSGIRAPVRSNSSVGGAQENKNPNSLDGVNSDAQAAYNLELWKRAEEAKFKAFLKQQEIEHIKEITINWKNKEGEREKQFAEALTKVAGLENKLRSKALDLQRREEKIIQLEEELKHKI